MKISARHEHDLGLQHDLELIAAQARQRRRVLSWMIAGGAAALVTACGGGDGSTTASTSTGSSGSPSSGGTATGTCLADPEETQGPYPGDGSNTVNGMSSNVLTQSGIVRSDIRIARGMGSIRCIRTGFRMRTSCAACR